MNKKSDLLCDENTDSRHIDSYLIVVKIIYSVIMVSPTEGTVDKDAGRTVARIKWKLFSRKLRTGKDCNQVYRMKLSGR